MFEKYKHDSVYLSAIALFKLEKISYRVALCLSDRRATAIKAGYDVYDMQKIAYRKLKSKSKLP